MTKTKELIFLFSVMFLQVKSFLPFGKGQFAIMSGDNVILVIGMIMVLSSNIFKKVKISKTTLYAFYSGVGFLFLIPLHLYVKNLFVFGGTSEGIGTIIKIILRLTFIYYFLKYLNISDEHYKKGLHTMLIFGIVITMSMIFEDLFVSLGFTVDKLKLGVDVEMVTESARFAGITGMNVNDLGALLCVFLGILFYMLKNKIIAIIPFIIYLISIAIGIMLTGSRTAFVIVNVIFLFFIKDYLKRRSLQNIILIVILFTSLYYIYDTFGIGTIKRIETNVDTEYFGLGGRMRYWELYLLDIRNNPIYLLIGNLAPPTYPRSAHNYYVQIVFQSGIILVAIAFFYLIKSMYSKRHSHKNNSILSLDYKYVLIPQLMIWTTTSSYISWFTLIAFGITGIYFLRNPQVAAVDREITALL